MTPEELHRRVYQKLGEGTGPEQLFEALLEVVAPFLCEVDRLHSDMVVDKAMKLNLVRPEDEFNARCLSNWDMAAFCEKIGVEFKEFIQGLW